MPYFTKEKDIAYTSSNTGFNKAFGLCLLTGSTTISLPRSLAHLLLVFPLGVEASLDAFPGLLKGLPLGALSGVVSAYSHDVGAGEDQHIGHHLRTTMREKPLTVQRHFPAALSQPVWSAPFMLWWGQTFPPQWIKSRLRWNIENDRSTSTVRL